MPILIKEHFATDLIKVVLCCREPLKVPASPFFTLLCTPWGKGGGTDDFQHENDIFCNSDAHADVVTQCGVAYNRTGQGGAKHEGGVDGKGKDFP